MSLTPLLLESLWRASWQGGIALFVVLLAARTLPRLSPRMRLALWRLAFIKLLVALVWATPLDVPLLPSSPIVEEALQPQAEPESAPVPFTPSTPTEKTVKPIAPQKAAQPVVSPAAHSRPFITLSHGPQLLLLPWLIGATFCCWRLAAAWRIARRLRQQVLPVEDDAVLKEYTRLCRRIGKQRAPRLTHAPDVPGPMLVGLLAPTIVVPSSLLAVGERDSLRLVLAHELAHVQGRDLWWNALTGLSQILFFFHPLVYIARREALLAQEIACDEMVLQTSAIRPADYAALLLCLSVGAGRDLSLVSASVASGTESLRRRLIAMQKVRPQSSRRYGAAVFLLVPLAAAVLIPWRAVAQQNTAKGRAVSGARKTMTATTGSRILIGTVVGPDNRPVADARVSWLPEGYGAKAVATGRTNKNGTFRLEADDAPDVAFSHIQGELHIVAPGLGTYTELVPTQRTTLRITLRRAVEVRVAFEDVNKRPLANLPVRVSWITGNTGQFDVERLNLPGFSARTDSKGIAVFHGLQGAQQVRLVVDDARFAKLATSDTLTLNPKEVVQTRHISLLPTLAIRGRLSYSPGGKPASGVRVWANYRNPARPFYLGSDIMEYSGGGARTDANGQYAIKGLRPGAYRIGVGVQGTPWTTAYREKVILNPEKPVDGANFVLTRGALVTGRVVDTRSGKPMQGVWVGGGPANAGIRNYVSWGITDANGRYRVRVPEGRALVHLRGTQKVSVPKDANGAYIGQTVGVRDGETVALNFQVTSKSQAKEGTTAKAVKNALSIRGRVSTTYGTQGASGVRVWATYFPSKLSSYLSSSIRDKDGNSTYTDAKGQYEIKGLHPGTYQVVASAPGRSSVIRQDLSLRTGHSVDGVDCVLPRGAFVSGRVVSARSGEPKPGVWVGFVQAAVDSRKYVVWNVTDADGKYRMWVPEGQALVYLSNKWQAEVPKDMNRVQTVVVRDSKPTTLNFRFPPQVHKAI